MRSLVALTVIGLAVFLFLDSVESEIVGKDIELALKNEDTMQLLREFKEDGDEIDEKGDDNEDVNEVNDASCSTCRSRRRRKYQKKLEAERRRKEAERRKQMAEKNKQAIESASKRAIKEAEVASTNGYSQIGLGQCGGVNRIGGYFKTKSFVDCLASCGSGCDAVSYEYTAKPGTCARFFPQKGSLAFYSHRWSMQYPYICYVKTKVVNILNDLTSSLALMNKALDCGQIWELGDGMDASGRGDSELVLHSKTKEECVRKCISINDPRINAVSYKAAAQNCYCEYNMRQRSRDNNLVSKYLFCPEKLPLLHYEKIGVLRRRILWHRAHFNDMTKGPRCVGQENGCCTDKNQCREFEGDCDEDKECEGNLVCGKNNCIWGKGDCCKRASRCMYGGDSCCGDLKGGCDVGEGDCDSWNSQKECRPGLRCGDNNCRKWGHGDSEDDCCDEKKPGDLAKSEMSKYGTSTKYTGEEFAKILKEDLSKAKQLIKEQSH